MTISIDCRSIDSSGIGVYLKGCLPYFLSSPHNFILMGDREKIEPFTNEHRNCTILDYPVKPFSLKEIFFFPPHIRKAVNGSDCFYSPFFNIPGFISIPVYTTIHDIIFPDMPELTSRAGLFIRMFFYKRAAKLSRKIFTVSYFSKSRIEYRLGTKKNVIVTYSALQPYLFQRDQNPIEKTNNIVFVGNIKKHKGLDLLLPAFYELKENSAFPYKLIIVGEKDNFRSSDSNMSTLLSKTDNSSVEFSGYIDNGKLRRLLAGAALLVQPSLYEGFGLPPLEAMLLGTKVLISDIPVFREIYEGFPVAYFKAGEVNDLKQKMKGLLENRPGPSTGYSAAIPLSAELADKYSFKKTSSIILRELTGPV
jgi:glycosyltransferase involved in cell wall biosynthesis